jgi:NO-binding membrane sensor protein with MHYT domain
MMTVNSKRPPGELTAAELSTRLGVQLSRLVRDEIALAKVELTASARQMTLGGALLGGAAVTAMYGLGVMIAAAVAAIALRLPLWAAALIVGGALLAVAGVLALLGRRRLRRGTPPITEAVGTVREDITQIASRIRR